MTYHRTQHGRWHYLFFTFAAATLGGAWLARRDLLVAVMVLSVCGVFFFCGLVFGSLTISDEGDCLAVRFGPLPLFSRRIPYADITAVEVSRTTILDGWGMHYLPFRGCTYNIWGFGCVKLMLGRKIVRLGTDEPEVLAAFVREKIRLGVASCRE
jgi:hypothetical protein